MGQPIISIRHMGKRYSLGLTHERLLANRVLHGIAGLFRPARKQTGSKDFWALRDLCMDVEPGEVLGLVRPMAPDIDLLHQTELVGHVSPSCLGTEASCR